MKYWLAETVTRWLNRIARFVLDNSAHPWGLR